MSIEWSETKHYSIGTILKISINWMNRSISIGWRNEKFKIGKFMNPINFHEYEGLIANYSFVYFRYRNIKPKCILLKNNITLPHPTFSKKMYNKAITT